MSIYLVRIIFYYFVADHIFKGLFPLSEHFEFRRFMLIFFNFMATSGLMIAIKSVRQQLDLKKNKKILSGKNWKQSLKC